MKKKSLPLSQQPSAVVIQFVHPTPAKGKSPDFTQTISPRNPPQTSLGEGDKPYRVELSLQRPVVPDVSYPYQGTHEVLNVPFAAWPRVQPWNEEVEPAETAVPSPAPQGGISELAAPKPSSRAICEHSSQPVQGELTAPPRHLLFWGNFGELWQIFTIKFLSPFLGQTPETISLTSRSQGVTFSSGTGGRSHW